MTNKISTNKHGFTIIEVVLVLAIAGLIFLMVFVALPALQRSQRDTQRRNDMARMATALTNWQTNHSGALPTTADNVTSFRTSYVVDGLNDPDGAAYNIQVPVAGNASTAMPSTVDHKVYIYTGVRCDGDKLAVRSGNNNFAIIYKLEGAGVSCTDNN